METIFNKIVNDKTIDSKNIINNYKKNININNNNSSNDNESKIDDSSNININEKEFNKMIPRTKNMIIGSELTIPIKNGQLNMGTWQGIWLCEHSNNDKDGRTVVVTVTGVTK